MKNSNEHIRYRDLPDPIDRRDERELIRLSHLGNLVARNTLVKANIRFVIKMVRTSYRNYAKTIPLEDIVDEGVFGLIRAIKEFDLSKKEKLISYAVWWIRAYIERGLTILIPQNLKLALYKSKKKAHLEGDKIDEKMEKIRSMAEIIDLNHSVGGEDIFPISSGVPEQEDSLDKRKVKELIDSLLDNLSENERIIVKKYFGLNEYEFPCKLEDICATIPLTRERLRQMKENAVNKLKKIANKKGYFRELKHNGYYSTQHRNSYSGFQVLDE